MIKQKILIQFFILNFFCFLFGILMPVHVVKADDRLISLTVIRPQNGIYTYVKTDTVPGADYVLYVVDGIDSADNVINWDKLNENLKYIDQKKAETTSLTFTIPQNAIRENSTLYIGDGNENKCYITGFISEETEVWLGNSSGSYYSDSSCTTYCRSEYKLNKDKSIDEIKEILPKNAYLRLQTAAPDADGKGESVISVPVKLEWIQSGSTDAFHIETDDELFFNANVTVLTDTIEGKTGAAWAEAFPVPGFRVTIKGPDRPAPKPLQHHRILVQNQAEAYSYSGGTSVGSACYGDKILIRWKRNYYSGKTSYDDYEFIRWIVTGAVPEDENNPQTSFVMGDSDVIVQLIEKKVLEAESGEEEPSDRDRNTKLSKLAYNKTSLTIEKGKYVNNSATSAPAKGIQADALPPVTYVTGNKNIVTVDRYGNFYGNDAGETVVTAYCGNKKTTCKVSVISPTEKLVILDANGISRPDAFGKTTFYEGWNKKPEETILIKSGEIMSLHAQMYPCDSTDAKNVTWNVWSWPVEVKDRYGNWDYPRDKKGNIVYKKDNKYLTIKNGVITARETREPNYNPVLVSATVKKSIIDPVTGKIKNEDLTAMVPVYVHPIIPEKTAGMDKTHTLSPKKKNLKMVTTEGNNTYDLELTISSKLKTDDVEKNYVIECESTNADVVSVVKSTDPVKTDKNGKKGTARITIRANNPGTAYIIVKSRNKENTAVNIQNCKITVTRPATAVSAVSGTLKIENGPINVYDKKTRTYVPSEDDVKILTMRKGSRGTIEALLTPYDTTDTSNVKIQAQGGVSIKNGMIFASSLTKPEKGGYAKVTVTCGKLKDTVYITVIK
ncbi:MAG: hypothetical protein IJT80_10810 [Lachnospiraceae bacterium]|nr:hypothetical protein [Lachnospiraceae bacterium]